jgi:dUTP pyrophosphatase
VDIKACLADLPGKAVTIEPGQRYPVPTGIAIEIGAPGVAGFVFSRSGLGTKKGLTVSQGVGVIDPDYRGEIICSLLNTSDEPRTIQHGDRIAQLLFLPYFAARIVPSETLSDTDRGAGGFGHTGV